TGVLQLAEDCARYSHHGISDVLSRVHSAYGSDRVSFNRAADPAHAFYHDGVHERVRGQQGSLTSTGREPEIFGLMPMSGTQRTSVDYRLSHTGRDKAQSYDRRFAENPHRAMMWALERDVIDEIIRTRLGGKVGSYLDFACGTGRILAHVERCAD